MIGKRTIPVLVFFLAIVVSTPCFGQGRNKEKRRGSRRPPQEAFTACENKEENDSCSVTTRKGDELNGVCLNLQDDFVCVPNEKRKRMEDRQE